MIAVMSILPIIIGVYFIFFAPHVKEMDGKLNLKLITFVNLFATFWLSKFYPSSLEFDFPFDYIDPSVYS